VVTAALARSGLHLAFLEHNAPDVDLVLHRDERLGPQIEQMFPGRGLYLGREQRPALHPLRFAQGFAANRRYYGAVRGRIEGLGVDRLILFLEGEPLERHIMTWFSGAVELWEEGLSHYVELNSRWWYAMRGLAQVAAGFYPRGALSRRVDRAGMVVRDRFAQRNLHLPFPVRAPAQPRVLVVGSPFVEDRWIKRDLWLRGMREIAAVSPLPLHYLPHPREDHTALPDLLAPIGNITVAPDPHGIFAHIGAHGYAGIVAPISTALLDIGAFGQSLFVPHLFRQTLVAHALTSWRDNPVRVARDSADMAAFLEGLATAAGQ